ncbi:unnamed protein product [Linum tenue]|uniref:Uncharacterized protein n=1 Tax=Linum tenue TaxID=586396 RepID=A0AAV0L580_9ROSI|nr:unnamed protein product [Linum tenue]
MSCNSKVCVDVENQFPQRRSVKPEWHKAHARFIINLCMEKERAANGNNSAEAEEGSIYGSWFTGGSKNNTSSPDAYVWRQRYLRSYTFTREEESSNERKKKKGVHGVVLKKVKRWTNQMFEGSSTTTTTKEGKKKKKSSSTVDGCLKFLLSFVAQVDVHVG